MIIRRRVFSFITLIILTVISLAACSASGENWGAVAAGRPVIGLAVEDSVNNEIAVDSQDRLRIDIENGNVQIIPGNGDKLLIKETLHVKGPAAKEYLSALLEKGRSKISKMAFSVNIDQKQKEKIKPLYGMADDIRVFLPESMNKLNISLINGSVSITGIDKLEAVEVSLVNGQIDVSQSSSDSIKVSVDKGNINMDSFSGNGIYDCGRGDINLRSVKGSVDLTSVMGRADIRDTEGKLKCDIASGKLSVRNSRIGSGSELYASTGSIYADLNGLENEGKLTVKSAAADLRLRMPENIGYSLIARSTCGRIYNKLNPSPGTLKKSPTGELYGDVAGGGASLDFYTDNGNIVLY